MSKMNNVLREWVLDENVDRQVFIFSCYNHRELVYSRVYLLQP